jgi:hypothetical protein
MVTTGHDLTDPKKVPPRGRSPENHRIMIARITRVASPCNTIIIIIIMDHLRRTVHPLQAAAVMPATV